MAFVCLAFSRLKAPSGLQEKLKIDRGTLNTRFAYFVPVCTADRLEIYTTTDSVSGQHQNGDTAFELLRAVSDSCQLPINQLNSCASLYFDRVVVKHLFQAVASLDAGSQQDFSVLDELVSSFAIAKQQQQLDLSLRCLFRHAIRVGQRSRSTVANLGNSVQKQRALEKIVIDELEIYFSNASLFRTDHVVSEWRKKLEDIRVGELSKFQSNDALEQRVAELMDRFSQALVTRIAKESIEKPSPILDVRSANPLHEPTQRPRISPLDGYESDATS